jgi:hypothetical protein
VPFGVFAMVPSWWSTAAWRALQPDRRPCPRPRPAAALATEPAPTFPRAMDFDFQWLLLGLPVRSPSAGWPRAWTCGQWKREQRESPKAYFKGLNLL